MPPNNPLNQHNSNSFKVGIDPVFKGGLDTRQNTKNHTADSVVNILNNQEYIFNHNKVVETSLQSRVEKPPNKQSIVRTYKSDFEHAVQADHLSSINIAIAENQKRHEQSSIEPNNSTPSSNYSKIKIFLFISLLLIVLGIIALTSTYWLKNINKPSIPITQELPSLITTENIDFLNINLTTENNFIPPLADKLTNTQIPVNNFNNVYIITGTSSDLRLVTAPEFVTGANFAIPDILKRALLPDFMIGTFSFTQNSPFLILKTSSFENSYAGMFAWEDNLLTDLGPLFKLIGYENKIDLLNDLTPTESRKFTDSVISNKDIREIKDFANQTILLYGLINEKTIVITVNYNTFKEIINRLNQENTLER